MLRLPKFNKKKKVGGQLKWDIPPEKSMQMIRKKYFVRNARTDMFKDWMIELYYS